MARMISRIAPACLVAALALPLLAACGDDPAAPVSGGDPPAAAPAGAAAPVRPAAPGDGDSPGDDGSQGTSPLPTEHDIAAAREKGREVREEMNTLGRALLASFERRCYSPVRNAGIAYAVGEVAVRAGGVEARYTFTWDGEQPRDRRTVVARADGAEGDRPIVPGGTERQVFDLVQLSLNGPYRYVVNYLPPTDVLLTPSRDGKKRVVTTQPHKVDIMVSYNVDERDIVTTRGTSVRPQSEIAYFAWDDWRGRYLLQETTFHGSDTVATFSYDEVDGAVLLTGTAIRKQGAAFDAKLTYERLDKKEPADPLAPQVVPRDPPDGEDSSGDPDTPK